ncbi:MAG: 3-phosphoserine/phosphohydroxythreonine transaminase [Armatimonadetes bacterium]|nr:3-phosphoserine/phosphohydroxythreonine transaminase [Armatimonadota bacterium]
MSDAYGRVFNFSAGPAVIPVPVLEQARDEMLNWNGAGLSVMEMSHRGKSFLSIYESALASVKELLGVPDNYKVLFLQGGASTQFSMVAQNFLHTSCDHVVTGAWGKKAVEAAKIEGKVNVVWDGKATNYNQTPDLASLTFDPKADYVHVTSNETIQGVDYGFDPVLGVPVVCDMSSNIASRPVDISKYALVFAGAQKNLGPSGVTLVILRDDMLEKIKPGLPPMADYKVHAENDSMYNTPPCWGIYILGLVCQHWIGFGGLAAVEKSNQAKAKVIYDAIDGSGGFYKGHAVPASRSLMNIPFTLPSEELTEKFLAETKKLGYLELKGHRSVGGCRASMYNAFPIEGAQALAGFMAEFARTNG